MVGRLELVALLSLLATGDAPALTGGDLRAKSLTLLPTTDGRQVAIATIEVAQADIWGMTVTLEQRRGGAPVGRWTLIDLHKLQAEACKDACDGKGCSGATCRLSKLSAVADGLCLGEAKPSKKRDPKPPPTPLPCSKCACTADLSNAVVLDVLVGDVFELSVTPDDETPNDNLENDRIVTTATEGG